MFSFIIHVCWVLAAHDDMDWLIYGNLAWQWYSFALNLLQLNVKRHEHFHLKGHPTPDILIDHCHNVPATSKYMVQTCVCMVCCVCISNNRHRFWLFLSVSHCRAFPRGDLWWPLFSTLGTSQVFQIQRVPLLQSPMEIRQCVWLCLVRKCSSIESPLVHKWNKLILSLRHLQLILSVPLLLNIIICINSDGSVCFTYLPYRRKCFAAFLGVNKA